VVQRRDPPLDDLLLPVPLGQPHGVGFTPARQVVNLRQDAQQFEDLSVRLAELRGELIPPPAEDAVIGAGRKRQLDLAGEQEQRPFLVKQAEFTFL
jgi:hypothetical protein